MKIEIITMDKSFAFSKGVSAQALKWKSAGIKNAVGVLASAPSTEINLSSLAPKRIVKTVINKTNKALWMFFPISSFDDYYQFMNK